LVGVLVGAAVGVLVGVFVGIAVGVAVGVEVGVFVGVLVGVVVGAAVAVGTAVAVAVLLPAEVITNCGGVPVSREVKVVPSEVKGGKVKLTGPFPVTRLVTSYSTQVLSRILAGPATPLPSTGGLVFQVIPVSVQSLPAR
jgi:hypothetical protein